MCCFLFVLLNQRPSCKQERNIAKHFAPRLYVKGVTVLDYRRFTRNS
jgi:hypothetical protein